MPIVTIRGQRGSGAGKVARLVAEGLHADYVDREIIGKVAVYSRRQEPDIEAKEMPPATLIGRIAEALGVAGSYGAMDAMAAVYLPGWQLPLSDDQYLTALESVVKKLASGGPLVIRGRGSQFILKDYPGSLHVLTVAPVEIRTKRVMEDLGIDEESAKREMANFDDSRKEFVRRYFKADLDDPVHYDLVVNTGRFSEQDAASIIVSTCSTIVGA